MPDLLRKRRKVEKKTPLKTDMKLEFIPILNAQLKDDTFNKSEEKISEKISQKISQNFEEKLKKTIS